MPIFRVIRKANNETVYAYSSDVAVEFPNLPFAEFSHIEEIAVNPDRSIDQLLARNITKREFIKRFTVGEYATIKASATQNTTLDFYWQMFMLAENINLDDPDTIAGVNMLEQAGLLAAGRAAEILA
jgi:hypothetical protein